MLRNVHVGCGNQKMVGFLNVDVVPTPVTDLVFDATQPWPIEVGTVGQVVSHHAIEHMQDMRGFFREMWQALADGGKAILSMPYGANEAALSDPFHVRPLYPTSFAFLLPQYGVENGNPQHEHWDYPFSIDVVQLQVHPRLRWLLRWPCRRWGASILDHLWNSYENQVVYLTALKSSQSVSQWQQRTGGTMGIPIQPVR